MPQTVGVHVGPALPNLPGHRVSYKVLALKYRPTTFDEVVGQSTVIRTPRNALEQDYPADKLEIVVASDGSQDATNRIVDALDSYTEVSPSGHGVKIFLRGRKPGRRCRKRIYLTSSELSEQGYEQEGPLLEAVQRILRQQRGGRP